MLRAVWLLTLLSVIGWAGVAPAIDSAWLNPIDGEWDTATNWSTSVAPKNGTPSFSDYYDVTIDAGGADYVVDLLTDTVVDRITLDSPGATLRISGSGTYASATNGIHIEQGTLVLDDRGTLSNTRVTAGPNGRFVTGPTNYTTVSNLTLATELEAFRYLTLDGTFQLENGTLRFAAGNIRRGTDLLGTGEWQLQSGLPDTFDFQYRLYFYERADEELLIGPNVTVRSMGETLSLVVPTYFTPEDTGTVVNQGTILAETDGGSFYISDFRNEGLIRVSGGDRFAAGFHGAVGDIELGADSSLSIYDSPHFNRPFTVGDGASVYIRAESQATAATPLVLQPGGVINFSTPESIVPIASTGGELLLSHYSSSPQLTASQLSTLPLTGPAEVRFSSAGLDLENTTFDYTTLPSSYTFNPSSTQNGTLTGPQVPQDLSHTLIDAQIDVPLDLATGRVELRDTSALLKPVHLAGGSLVLKDDWSNTAGITASLGDIQLYSTGAQFGSINMSGGELVVAHDTTLADLLALSFGTPETIEIGSRSSYDSRSTLDLDGATLDLDTWPTTNWKINREGRVENGTIIGTHEGPTLQVQQGSFDNVLLDGVKTSGGSFGNSTLRNVWSTGFTTTSGTVIDSRVDGTLHAGTVQGTLESYGFIKGTVLFDAGATIVGTATLGTNSGRFQRDHFTFVDATYVLPEEVSIESATQYDSHATIDAANTGLTVMGDITVGHETFVRESWTDSLTFEIASLHTSGVTTVTEDGSLIVNGGPWTNLGALLLSGGQVQATSLHVDSSGSLEGWGSIEGDVAVDGFLSADYGDEQLTVGGELYLSSTAATKVTLGSPESTTETPPRITVAGEAVIQGSLAINFSLDFLAQELTVGDSFPLLTAGLITSVFDTLAWDLPWIELDLIYTTDTVLIEITQLQGVPSLRGDANGDGTVDAADYTVWRDHLGETVAWFSSGDFDGSGVVDHADHAYWIANFGNELASLTPAVPEPSTGLLLWIVLSTLATRRLPPAA